MRSADALTGDTFRMYEMFLGPVEMSKPWDTKGIEGVHRFRGIRRYVAGTTNKDGEFICELPVTTNTGLTYDVDVTWPREYGSEVERKSITLNADRTHFTLPFYRSLKG